MNKRQRKKKKYIKTMTMKQLKNAMGYDDSLWPFDDMNYDDFDGKYAIATFGENEFDCHDYWIEEMICLSDTVDERMLKTVNKYIRKRVKRERKEYKEWVMLRKKWIRESELEKIAKEVLDIQEELKVLKELEILHSDMLLYKYWYHNRSKQEKKEKRNEKEIKKYSWDGEWACWISKRNRKGEW